MQNTQNQTDVNEQGSLSENTTTQEDLLSNSEILHRQMHYLGTVKTYLENQLAQVEQALSETSAKLNP